jgi:hypothetical protein
MNRRSVRLLIALAALVAVGCSARPEVQRAVPYRVPNNGLMQAPPPAQPGSRTTTVAVGALQFSTTVTSTTVTAAEGIRVHLRLTNAGATSVTWRDLSLGWAARVSGVPGVESVSYGLGFGIRSRPTPPVTLASGETTSTLLILRAPDLRPGVYRLNGGFIGGGGPKGSAPEIIVTVKAR